MIFQVVFLVLLVAVVCHGYPNPQDDRGFYNSIGTGLGRSARSDFGPDNLDHHEAFRLNYDQQLNAFDSNKQFGFDPKPVPTDLHNPSELNHENQSEIWSLGYEPQQPGLDLPYLNGFDIENEHRLRSQNPNFEPHQPSLFVSGDAGRSVIESYDSGIQSHQTREDHEGQTRAGSQIPIFNSNHSIGFFPNNNEQSLVESHSSGLDPPHQKEFDPRNLSRTGTPNIQFSPYLSDPDQQVGLPNQGHIMDFRSPSILNPEMLNRISSHHSSEFAQEPIGQFRSKEMRPLPYHSSPMKATISEIFNNYRRDGPGLGFKKGFSPGKQETKDALDQGFVKVSNTGKQEMKDAIDEGLVNGFNPGKQETKDALDHGSVKGFSSGKQKTKDAFDQGFVKGFRPGKQETSEIRRAERLRSSVSVHQPSGSEFHHPDTENINRFESQRQIFVPPEAFSPPEKSQIHELNNNQYPSFDPQHYGGLGLQHRQFKSHHPTKYYKTHNLSFSPLFKNLFKFGFGTHVGKLGSFLPGRFGFDDSQEV